MEGLLLVRLESWIHKTSQISISSSKIKIRKSYRVSCRQISTYWDSSSSKDSKSKTRLKSRYHHKLRIMEYRWNFKGVAAVLPLESLNLSKTNLMFNILLHSLVLEAKAHSKLRNLRVGIFHQTTLEATLPATIMVVRITGSDRVLQMTLPSNHLAISLSRLTKEFSKLWITSVAHRLIMEINSKLLKVRSHKSKETITSNYHLRFPLSNSNLKSKSLPDSSPNSNPNSLNKFNNSPNHRLRWIP
jgi:hypothetical protein